MAEGAELRRTAGSRPRGSGCVLLILRQTLSHQLTAMAINGGRRPRREFVVPQLQELYNLRSPCTIID
uniref:Uncharacterized protein n=1 Tax=Oryza rufipogon TaxID=4529 RepID=A0A0E0QPT3_ORYRU